jgi:hypothetical protein
MRLLPFRHLLWTFAAATALALLSTPAQAAQDDPSEVVTVMQFAAKNPASVPELKKRMLAMRDFQRKQTGLVDNALYENRNPQTAPQYVGVARWKQLKNWEDLWQNGQFQTLVRAVSEVGTVTPGVYGAVK